MTLPASHAERAQTLQRVRRTMLIVAVAGSVLSAAPLAGAHGSIAVRLAGALALAGLALHWVAGYRRSWFSVASEIPETLLMLVVLFALGGETPVPLFGMVYRPLYGRSWPSAVRVAAWSAAVAAVYLERGSFDFEDWSGKTAGLVLATTLMQLLAAAVKRLERSETRLRAVLDHSADVITIVDRDSRIAWLSNPTSRVLGHAPERLYGAALCDFVHPDDAEGLRRALAAPGEADVVEFRMRDGDGGERDIEAVIDNRVDDPHIGGFLLTLRDATDRRRLERERIMVERLAERVEAQRERQQMEARLQRAQRLESVGQLAGGVAHDFNNLLAAILNYAELARDELPEGAPAREDVAEIEASARRGARLVRQLLLFSQGEATEAEPLSLNGVVRSLDGLLRGSLGSNVELAYDLDEALAEVEADVTNVEQMVVNLVINARDALGPRGGRIVIRTGAEDLDAVAAVDHDIAPGAYVRLAVSDDGCGMDAETLAHVLEPFFTTKPFGEGTGLGLSTVHGIVSSLGGYVGIDSAPGAGTTVSLHLPARRVRVPAPAAA